jgi:hypothetical protein
MVAEQKIDEKQPPPTLVALASAVATGIPFPIKCGGTFVCRKN